MATKKYSILAAIRSLSGDANVGGFERELTSEMLKRKKLKREYCGGIILPDVELLREAGAITSTAGEETLGRPVHGVIDGIGGNGSATIETSVLLSQFIPALVARTVLGRAGAMHLENLVGNVAIPKGGSVEAGWITTEGGNASKKNPTFDQVAATPHTISVYTDITRSLMVQTSNAAEAIVITILRDAIARGIDKAGFTGSGSNGEPTGLASINGVHTINMTADKPTKAKLSEFWEALENANVDTTNAKWIVSPSVKGLLGKTLDITTIKNAAGTDNVGGVSSGEYLVSRGRCEDYPVLMSGLSGAKKAWFGNWADLIIATWSTGIEILVDRFTNSASGGSRVVAMCDADIMCRYPEAFAVGTVLS